MTIAGRMELTISPLQEFDTEEMLAVQASPLRILTRALWSQFIGTISALHSRGPIVVQGDLVAQDQVHSFLQTITVLRFLHRRCHLGNGSMEMVIVEVLQEGRWI